MAGDIEVTFISHHRKAQTAPDPKYPNGIDIDAGAKVACLVELPYPAKCCGVLLINCKTCHSRVVLTVAGRVDDPRTVKLPCFRKEA